MFLKIFHIIAINLTNVLTWCATSHDSTMVVFLEKFTQKQNRSYALTAVNASLNVLLWLCVLPSEFRNIFFWKNKKQNIKTLILQVGWEIWQCQIESTFYILLLFYWMIHLLTQNKILMNCVQMWIPFQSTQSKLKKINAIKTLFIITQRYCNR